MSLQEFCTGFSVSTGFSAFTGHGVGPGGTDPGYPTPEVRMTVV